MAVGYSMLFSFLRETTITCNCFAADMKQFKLTRFWSCKDLDDPIRLIGTAVLPLHVAHKFSFLSVMRASLSWNIFKCPTPEKQKKKFSLKQQQSELPPQRSNSGGTKSACLGRTELLFLGELWSVISLIVEFAPDNEETLTPCSKKRSLSIRIKRQRNYRRDSNTIDQSDVRGAFPGF